MMIYIYIIYFIWAAHTLSGHVMGIEIYIKNLEIYYMIENGLIVGKTVWSRLTLSFYIYKIIKIKKFKMWEILRNLIRVTRFK